MVKQFNDKIKIILVSYMTEKMQLNYSELLNYSTNSTKQEVRMLSFLSALV